LLKVLELGEECKVCLCAKCGYREHCVTMCGDTELYCQEECKGEDGAMTGCSQFESLQVIRRSDEE